MGRSTGKAVAGEEALFSKVCPAVSAGEACSAGIWNLRKGRAMPRRSATGRAGLPCFFQTNTAGRRCNDFSNLKSPIPQEAESTGLRQFAAICNFVIAAYVSTLRPQDLPASILTAGGGEGPVVKLIVGRNKASIFWRLL